MGERIFREAQGYPGAAVRFTGWGEPLLHPEISQLAALAKKYGLALKIYTNGLALTERLMEHFVDIGVDDLQFSLQGITPRQYEFNRRGASHKILEERISMAHKVRRAAKRPFLSILTSGLADELEEADPREFAKRWLKVVDKVAIDLTNLNFVKETEGAKPLLGRQSKGLTRKKCVDVFLSLEIKYDGMIQFCGQDARGLPSHTIGRFGDMSLTEAWIDPKMEAQRDLVGRALGHADSPVCANCYHNTQKYDIFKKALLERTTS
jgi:hypothetical protein